MKLRALAAPAWSWAILLVSPAWGEFRTIDGSGNNRGPNRTTWGAADTNVIRFGYPGDYPDGYGDVIASPTSTPAWPNARSVSNALFAQSAPIYNNRNLSDWVVQWGQFLTHDMDLTTNGAEFDELFTGGTGDFSIPILDAADPLGPNPIPFHRSNYNPTTGTPTPLPAPPPVGQRPNWREQINSVTSYIDASNVYGSDAARAAALRTFVDGKLVTSAGGLLPGLNAAGLANDDPFHQGAAQFLAGDVRANEQVGLTATHSLFIREHNRLAGLIKAVQPGMNDEAIYQTARKIVGAEMQIITYEEFLPAIMGTRAPSPTAYVYSPGVDASITNSFATAFFRFGHSMQSSELKLTTNDGSSAGALSLAGSFFNPAILKDSPGNVELILKGLGTQVAQENDVSMVDALRNFLFGPPGAGGLDLAALDVQRGRDHGLLDYNAFRPAYGLLRLPSINALTSDPALRAKLTAIYGNINSIDAFVGALAENHVPGTSVGAMLLASLADQFSRLRDGDRFFYTGDPDLRTALVESVVDLDNLTLASVIRANTALTNVQDDVFFALQSADFDGDGDVDAVDLATWHAGFGTTSGATHAQGDANADGAVDAADLLAIQKQFGVSSALAASRSAAGVVPEPSSLCGALLAAALVGRIRRRRR
jgi:hypothetical protein